MILSCWLPKNIIPMVFNGEVLPVTTQIIEAEQSGNYQVEVTDSLGCMALSQELTVNITGTEDELLAKQPDLSQSGRFLVMD